MIKKRFLGLILVLLFKPLSIFSQTSIVTQHNDIKRTGWDSTETILNTKNVNASSFGFIFSRPLDDQMYAQPLVVSKVPISGVNVNVLYAATVNNTVYAYNADDGAVTTPYWQINLTESGMRPPVNTDVGSACGTYLDFTGKIGIVGTPVIDTITKKMFVVARSVDASGKFYQYLHSINITNGADSKVLITAQVPGNGVGSASGNLSFNSATQNQRSALLLLNGVVYIAYASHCDTNPYHGWVLGYNENTLTQKYVFVNNSNDGEGGIWMGGAAPAADDLGNVFVASGNGNGTVSGSNLHSSLIKLTPDNISNTLSVSSYFAPYNYVSLSNNDRDFGVTQVLLIPNTNLALTGCKDGNLYLADKDNMGGVGTSSNTNLQTLNVGGAMHSSFGYYKGLSNEFIYLWSENRNLAAIPFNRITNLLGTPIRNTTLQGPVGSSGSFLSVSSKGSKDSTAILWVSHATNCNANHQTCPGILRAIAANDITKELWNSNLVPSDAVGNFAKFSCPTIANGKVYLATFSNRLMVYGLKTSGIILPVSLISFNADRLNNSAVSLNWKTAIEQNNKGFEIQRSDVNDNSKFQTISFVPSKAINGNSTTPLEYQFEDTNSSQNVTFYRLAQIDIDSKHTYSNIVAVKGILPDVESKSLLIIPNPSSGSMLTVQYKLNQQGNVFLKIMDLQGNILQSASINGQNAGTRKYLFNNLNLPSGFYIVSLELNNQIVAREKFIVNRQ